MGKLKRRIFFSKDDLSNDKRVKDLDANMAKLKHGNRRRKLLVDGMSEEVNETRE